MVMSGYSVVEGGCEWLRVVISGYRMVLAGYKCKNIVLL